MKRIAGRILATILALMLLGSVVVPMALASESRIASNAGSITSYVGMKTQLTITNAYGAKLDVTNYKWKSSKTTVASVSSRGVVTAKKTGSTTITATNRYNSRDKISVVFKVYSNKYTNPISKPAATSVSYQNWNVILKSMEVLSPTKVCVEYYLVANYPGNWQLSKLNYLSDNIRAHSPSTDNYIATVVKGYGSTVSGFRRLWGRSVQTIKINFTGTAVSDTDLRLANYRYYYKPVGNLTYYRSY